MQDTKLDWKNTVGERERERERSRSWKRDGNTTQSDGRVKSLQGGGSVLHPNVCLFFVQLDVFFSVCPYRPDSSATKPWIV